MTGNPVLKQIRINMICFQFVMNRLAWKIKLYQIKTSGRRLVKAPNVISQNDARLNGDSWWRSVGIVSEWIQADIGYQTNVSAVITQGQEEEDPSISDWVTVFHISIFLTSNTDAEQIFIKDDEGNVMVSSFPNDI